MNPSMYRPPRILVALILLTLILPACNPNVEIRRFQLINQTPYEITYFGVASTEDGLATATNRLDTSIPSNAVANAEVDNNGWYWLKAIATVDDATIERVQGPIFMSKGIIGWAWNLEDGEIVTGTDPEDIYAQTSLPILVIDTYGEAIPDEPKIAATLHCISNDQGDMNQPTIISSSFSSAIAIERRGHSTQTFPKRSWGFELRDEAGEDLDAPLLGLPEEEDWVLYGPWMDRSLIRNVFGYGLWRDMGWYAPRTQFCEVYLHDNPGNSLVESYHGVYVLTEKIKRDDLRLNLAPLDTTIFTEPGLTGGYLLEMKLPGRLKDDELTIPLSDGFVVTLVSPNQNKITSIQQAWIADHLAEFESVLFGEDFTDPETGYTPYINEASFIDYILFQELIKNRDAFHSSTFFYKDREGPIHMGPVWDLNIGMGYFSFLGCQNTDGWILYEESHEIKRSLWTPRLFDDPGFTQRYINRWFELRDTILSTEAINASIDAITAELDTAQARQFIRWPSLGKTLIPDIRFLMFTGPHPASYTGEIAYMKDWLQERAAWIDANIDSL